MQYRSHHFAAALVVAGPGSGGSASGASFSNAEVAAFVSRSVAQGQALEDSESELAGAKPDPRVG